MAREIHRRVFPCADCGARDPRDEAHAQGCPRWPPLPKAELLRIARNVERLWAEEADAEREEARGAAA